MKKIFLLVAACSFITMSFAFEGVIEQVYTDVNTHEQKTFVWYIQNENIRLDIKDSEGSMSIIPDFKALSLMLFGDKPDNNGDHWYSNSPISTIAVEPSKLRLLEETETMSEGKKVKELKLMSSNGLVVVQYMPEIALNMKNMTMVFAESVEFSAIALANDAGFPMNSMIMNEEEALYTLSTKSVEEKSVDAAMFKVPSNYKLFTGLK